MNMLFPSLTSEEFREGCKVALARRRKKYPDTNTIERGGIEQALAKIIRERSDTVCESVTETIMEDNQKQNAVKSIKNSEMSCQKCGKKFIKMKNLMNHMEKGHLEDNMQMCTVCSKKFMNRKTLSQHMKNKHDTEQFLCNECGEECSSMFTLKVHQKNAHTIVMCDRQNCEFEGTPPEVRKHTHNRHRTGKSVIEVKCTKCEKVFTSRQGLLYHKKNHEEVEAKWKAQAVEILSPEHPGAAPRLPGIAPPLPPAPALPLPPAPAPKVPVAIPQTKMKKSKRKKEIPTLPAPSCEYEQIRANNVAAKESLLKSMNEAETTNQPFPIHWPSSQPGSHQPPLWQQQSAAPPQQSRQQQSGAPQQEQQTSGQQTVVLNSSGQQYLAPKRGAITGATDQLGAPGRGQALASSTPQPVISPAPQPKQMVQKQFSPGGPRGQQVSSRAPTAMQQSVPLSTVSSAQAPRTEGSGAGVKTPGAPAVTPPSSGGSVSGIQLTGLGLGARKL